MKKHIFTQLLIALFLIPTALMGKGNFEAGSITLANGEKVEGLIRSSDPRKLSSEVFFKSSINADGQLYYPSELQGFSIGSFLYKSAIVDVLDKDFQTVKTQSNPKLRAKITQKEVFLEVLLKADLSLFAYFDEEFTEFFFTQREGKDIEALWVIRTEKGFVNNRDISQDVSTTGIWELSQVDIKVKFYLLQIGVEIKDCEESLSQLKNLKLQRKPLVKFLTNYQNCKTQQAPEYLTTRTQTFQTSHGINLVGSRVMTDFTSPQMIAFRDYQYLDKTEFASYYRPTFGYFLEKGLLPFQTRLSLFTGVNIGVYQVEGTYRQGTEEAIGQGNYSDYSYKYSSVDFTIPIAFRYYINDRAKTRVFIQSGLDLIGFVNIDNQLQKQSYLGAELQKDESLFAIANNLTRKSNIGAHIGIGADFGRFYAMIGASQNRGFTSRRTSLESNVRELKISLGVKLN